MKIQENVRMSDYTTMGVGGPAHFFAVARTREDLAEALSFGRERQLRILFLGGGSNIIPTDAGFNGLVIHIGNTDLIWNQRRRQLSAGAGVSMANLVLQTTKRGWQGLEWAGGLPGTLGGAVRGNAGAFGGEIKDSVLSVEAIDPVSGQETTWNNDVCQFAYRSSVFKTLHPVGAIIWAVGLGFEVGDPAKLTRLADEKITYRHEHHPQGPSAGSMFKNLWVSDLPIDLFKRFPALAEKVRGDKLSAGAVLEQLGLKGRTVGGAMISTHHANIIINPGTATAADVRALADLMKAAVLDRYGLTLHEEPEFLA